MFIFLCICAVLCTLYFYITVRLNLTLRMIMKMTNYQLYYYILGFKGIIEDFAFANCNKTKLLPRIGEVAVITGGARGIGVEVVKKLLTCGMDVVIGCRNVKAGEETVKKILESEGVTGNASCIAVDIGCLKSVRSFAAEVLKRCSRIDYLINNAGIMFVPYAETEDGFESHFAVNYLGHCLLTHLLLPKMIATGAKKRSNCRIVNVSSCGHLAGSIDFSDFNMRNDYIASASYAQSKLAQILFTKSLDSRLKSLNIPVQVHAVHPGLVDTDLFNGTSLKIVAPFLPGLLFKTPEQGAITTVHACISPSWEGKGGNYISNCRESEVSKIAESKEVQEKLWTKTLLLMNVERFADIFE
ncbi:hypothetical protein C0J52_07161 [Blattella germanica]|nr:hypothetical protein C0J52_07161 [Blattella germanica]